MTSAERRFLARIREQARRQAKPIAAPAEKQSACSTSPWTPSASPNG
jgi:hypothetical protein